MIVAKTGRPVRIDFDNWLPPIHPLPVDHTIPGAESRLIENRTCVHMHGGLVPWTSDGGPFAWTTPLNLIHGPDWQPGDVLYPNAQSARFVWYHDHAFGITRLNAYAGLASAYLMPDDAEAALISAGAIPDVEIPLVIQDKGFVPSNIHQKDPKWRWGTPGDLWYPHVYEDTTSRPHVRADGIWRPLAAYCRNIGSSDPSNVPEAFFDTTVINGACYPYLKVEPRRYRFRILNGANARFYNLQLYVAEARAWKRLRPAGPGVHPDRDRGRLPANAGGHQRIHLYPLPSSRMELRWSRQSPFNLLLAPAERADVIIDFRGFAGATLILYSDTPCAIPGRGPAQRLFYGSARPDCDRRRPGDNVRRSAPTRGRSCRSG